MKLVAALAALTTLAAPAVARGGDVALRMQEIPVGQRALAAVDPPMHFNMLGAHWLGDGSVSYRVHRLHGPWSRWVVMDADTAPDAGTGVWHDGNLDWTGASDGLEFRAGPGVERLRAYELWSRVTTAPRRRLSEAPSPAIITRAEWGANEEIVRAKPLIAPTLKLAIVHHTAGTNDYSRAQAPAIVRGIEAYHVEGNGWNDIGYNFLVDRFGDVYEGRAGGIEDNVVGAHAQGFNSGSVGVALIGDYQFTPPSTAQQNALVRLLAWRLDVAHVDPLSRVVYTSGGNLKFRAGKVVTLRVISGHRDTGPTECPGDAAYALLPRLARRVSQTGLPKLYSPTVAGVLGGPIRFQARLSSALTWTVTIVDSSGLTVATGTGRGSLVDWTWPSSASSGTPFTWTITAPGVLAATGTLGRSGPAPPPPAPRFSLTNLAVRPQVVTPTLAGSGDLVTVSFTLGSPARVTAVVLDATGNPVLTVFDGQREAGDDSFFWAGHVLPDGHYTLAATARAGTRSVTKAASFTIDRTLSGLQVSPALITPNGDGVEDTATFTFVLAQATTLRLDILQNGQVVTTPFQGQLAPGPQTLVWDGTANGVPLPSGIYTAQFTVTDTLGDVAVTVPITIDSS